MFMVSQVPHLSSTSLLVSLFYFSFSDTNHICQHIFQHPLLLLATSNFSLLISSSSIFHHVQLPVYYDITGSLLFSTPYSLTYILFLSTLTLLLSSIITSQCLNSCFFYFFHNLYYLFIFFSCLFLMSLVLSLLLLLFLTLISFINF